MNEKQTFEGRASKVMQLAVNAYIDDDRGEVERLVKEHKLDKEEVVSRVEYRNNEKYDLSKKKRNEKALLSMLDENTPICKLLQLIEKAQQLLASKHPDQVDEVERAIIKEVELERELEEVRKKKQAA